MNATPSQILTRSVRTLLISGPAALVIPLAWAFGVIPEEHFQPVAMLYAALLLVAVAAGAVACLASCHLTTVKAFSAGYRTAHAEQQAGRPDLRVVE